MAASAYYLSSDGKNFIPVSAANPLPVTSGGGGGSAPLTNDDFVAVMGEPTDAAWNGADASATVVAVLKALYPILNLISTEVNEIDQDMDIVKGLLNDIKTNTTPAG